MSELPTTAIGYADSPRANLPCVTEPARAPRVVAIGGGTGLPVVLRALLAASRQTSTILKSLTALVTVTDDGGSSGVLRKQLNMLPPGDARNCLVALAGDHSQLSQVLQYRFEGGSPLAGHAVGNLLLAALAQHTGSFLEAIDRLAEILNLPGRVLPVTESNAQLRAELDTGEIVDGETTIVRARGRIRRIGFDRDVRPMPDAIRALVNADIVVVGPGSLYTSILPNLLVTGVAPTLSGINAVRIYVANLMTQPGETDGYSLEDHLAAIREHARAELFDYVLVNKAPLPPARLSDYANEGAAPVRYDPRLAAIGSALIVQRDLAASLPDGRVRHSPEALGAAVLELGAGGRRPQSMSRA